MCYQHQFTIFVYAYIPNIEYIFPLFRNLVDYQGNRNDICVDIEVKNEILTR